MSSLLASHLTKSPGNLLALPYLKPGAVIIGTSSVQETDPSPELFDYAQTKAATTSYIRSLAKQLGPKGVRVNGVAAGPIWAPLQVSGFY